MKIGGRPEPVSVAIGWDDLRLGAICQTYSEIAGSPRNIFRYSGLMVSRGRALNEIRRRKMSLSIKLRMLVILYQASQTLRAKLMCLKGNSPDFRLRSLNKC